MSSQEPDSAAGFEELTEEELEAMDREELEANCCRLCDIDLRDGACGDWPGCQEWDDD